MADAKKRVLGAGRPLERGSSRSEPAGAFNPLPKGANGPTVIGRLSGALRRLRSALVAGQRSRDSRRLRRELSGSRDFSFTTDYVSSYETDWTRVLEPLAGRAAVRLLEIGSFEGRSAVWFLEHVLTDPTAELVCVDLFGRPDLDARFDHNVALADRHGRVRKLKGRSGDVLPSLSPGSFDAVYVDGGHDAGTVLLDAMLSWRLLKPGGVMIMDDYLWEPHRPPSARPQLAIDIFREAMGGAMEVLHEGYQIILRKVD